MHQGRVHKRKMKTTANSLCLQAALPVAPSPTGFPPSVGSLALHGRCERTRQSHTS